MAIMKIIGGLCYAFAAADFGLAFFGVIDLTGVSWSPIVAIILGAIFFKMGGGSDE